MVADGSTPRRVWAQACLRIAVIAAGFSVVLGAMLIFNSFRLYQDSGNGRLRLVEAEELAPLKAALREDPKNESLKQRIRELDRRLREDYFRREARATRGGWMLVGGTAVFLACLQLSTYLKSPRVPVPRISPKAEDPARVSVVAAKAVTGTALGLAGLTLAMLWGAAPQWRDNHPAAGVPSPTAKPDATAVDPDWFPSDEETAANWPRFRGPDGSGHSALKDLPESWDGPSGTNVLWKTEIPLPGENSPVIWGKRVFLTGADAKRREVYALDADTGALLWKKPVGTPQSGRAEPPEVMEDTGYAAPTAVTDGRRVFAMFANGDIAGFTSEGEPLWVRALGVPENMYGHAASLAMWRNRVIVVFDQADVEAGKSKIMALDANTGEPVWSTPRPVANSWVSPIVINHQGREQVITSADPWVIAYDPATGKELWKAECMRGDVAASPVHANGLVYLGSDQTAVLAIKPDGAGDVSGSKIAWKNEDAGLPDLCSMFCDGPRVYTLVFGTLHAFDALSGEHLWEHETDLKFEASPSMFNGRMHLLSTDGIMIHGMGGPDGFKETGRSALGEDVGASPAFAPGRIYLRGVKHLYCIGKKNGN